jgi:hypothetical protein
MPPVSNVFHSLPQVQNHLSSLRGDQPHNGHRTLDQTAPGRVNLAIWNDDRILSEGTHACSNRTAQPARSVFSPAPATGFEYFSYFSTSGPPYSQTTIAFIFSRFVSLYFSHYILQRIGEHPDWH